MLAVAVSVAILETATALALELARLALVLVSLAFLLGAVRPGLRPVGLGLRAFALRGVSELGLAVVAHLTLPLCALRLARREPDDREQDQRSDDYGDDDSG